MPRKDWYYVPLPVEQSEILDEIVKEEGRKYGILDKAGLVRIIIGDFLEKYEKSKHNLSNTRNLVREHKKNDSLISKTFFVL